MSFTALLNEAESVGVCTERFNVKDMKFFQLAAFPLSVEFFL